MGTRMNIEIRPHPDAANQERLYIYRHWDGYPEIEGHYNPATQSFEPLEEPELSDVGMDLSRLYTTLLNQDWPMSPKRIGDWIMYMGAEDIAVRRYMELAGARPINLIDSFRWSKPSHYEWTDSIHGDIEWHYIIEYNKLNDKNIPSITGHAVYDKDAEPWTAHDLTENSRVQLNARDERMDS